MQINKGREGFFFYDLKGLGFGFGGRADMESAPTIEVVRPCCWKTDGLGGLAYEIFGSK